MTISRTKMLAALGALLALAAAAAIVLASSDSSDASPEPSTGERFSVLKPVNEERMNAVPDQTRATLAALAESELPGNEAPEAITEVGVSKQQGGNEFAVATLGETVCAVRSADSACEPVRQTSAGELFGARPQGCDTYWVFGVAPDGVTSVQIDSGGDGSVDTTLPVASNVYEGELEAVKTVATGVSESGETLFTTSFPLDYYAETNEACG